MIKRLAEWWSSLPDWELFGWSFCAATTGTWRSWRFTRADEMFHNGERFIPGISITAASFVLQISRTKDWKVQEATRQRLIARDRDGE